MVCITIKPSIMKTYIVASIYTSSETLNELAFDRMIQNWLILGYSNGRSHLWGADQENEPDIVKWFCSYSVWYLSSTKLPTRSLVMSPIYMDVACEVSSDRLGSNHHPMVITANTSDQPVPERVPKWNFKKAKWDVFQDQCITKITSDLFNDFED